jgi:NAD(P)-dependent dehydrogenase (short-subunit alcohol dehydrogenase family)
MTPQASIDTRRTMNARTALVTGASRGIGREVARTLATEGWQVLSAVRDPKSAPPGTQAEAVDMGNPDSIEALAGRLRAQEQKLDALVNNAGVYDGSAREIWDVNVLGPLVLTLALEPLLATNARVVMVTSGLGKLASQRASLVKRLTSPDLSLAELEPVRGQAAAAGDPGQRDKPRLGSHRHGRTQCAPLGGAGRGQRSVGRAVACGRAVRRRVRGRKGDRIARGRSVDRRRASGSSRFSVAAGAPSPAQPWSTTCLSPALRGETWLPRGRPLTKTARK